MISTITLSNSKKHEEEYINQNFPLDKYYRIVVEPDGASVKIGQVKNLKKELTTIPSKERLVWIKQAETLTPQAQNSLLKILEEPPSKTTIVLSSNNLSMLLPTIRSRCRVVRVKEEVGEKDKEVLTLIKQALKENEGERIVRAQGVAKKRDEAIEWMDKALSSLNHSLKETDNEKSLKVLRQIIKPTLEAKQRLEKNVNVTLTLENYFLSLPKVKS